MGLEVPGIMAEPLHPANAGLSLTIIREEQGDPIKPTAELLHLTIRKTVWHWYEPHSRRSATPFYWGRTPTPAYAHSVLSDRG